MGEGPDEEGREGEAQDEASSRAQGEEGGGEAESAPSSGHTASAGRAQPEEGSRPGHEATRRVEGPVAPVQVPQEAARGGIPPEGPSETQALGLLRLPVQLLQIIVALDVLHRLGVVSLPEPLLVLQLLLQPLLPAQLVQRQPLQVSLVLHLSVTEPGRPEERQTQSGASSLAT